MWQKFNFRRGLAFKMILSIFLAIAAIFVIVFLYNYSFTRKTVIQNLHTIAENLTENTVLKVDRILLSISQIPDNFVPVFEQSDKSEKQIKSLLKMMVRNNPQVFGAAIAFEPFYEGRKEKYYSYYAYRKGDSVIVTTLGNDTYDYFTMDWYQIPRETGHSDWSEPYYDEGGGNIIMSTYSVPMFSEVNGKKLFIGVLTADISLSWLRVIVDSVKVYETGYAYLISENGTIVTHPRNNLVMNASIFSLAEEKELPELREIGKKMIHREHGFSMLNYPNMVTGKESWLAYEPVPSNGWSLAVVFPVKEFMADAYRLNQVIIILAIAGLLLILMLIIFIARSVTKPLRKLTYAAASFAEGNFNVTLPRIRSKDEIGRLTSSFAYMQQTLAETIGNLKDTSEQLRVSNEKLEEYNKTLEQKVEERTAELLSKNRELDDTLQHLKAAQTQLVQSEKMASLGQLTAGIAHEIKNPLNFVNNFAELSIDLVREVLEELDKLSDTLDPKDMEYLKEILTDLMANCTKINEHGKRADSIIRGMLLHSRGKSGEKQLSDINAILAEYVNLGYHGMRASDSSFNIKIESEYDPAIGMVNIVPQDMSRVFLNIINNACFSTDQKKRELKDSYFPVLQVTTKNYEQFVEIRIRDNGKGMPAQVLEKVFNPFFTTKAAGKGTGLGMSISYDIVVQEHQGEILVESQEGEFAEFIIRIPKNLT